MNRKHRLLLLLIIFKTSLITAYGYFREDTILLVPSEYPDINSALYDLDEKPISSNVTVKIQVEDGTYQYDSSILIDHPYAQRIEIIGNPVNPSNCVLVTTHQGSAIEVTNTRLSLIDGFTIRTTNGGIKGISAISNAEIKCGSNIIVDGFSYGISANRNSTIIAKGITIKNSSVAGASAYSSSFVNAQNAILQNNGTYGIDSVSGSFITANGASTSGHNVGFRAINGSFIEAINSNSSGDTTAYDPAINTSIEGNYIKK